MTLRYRAEIFKYVLLIHCPGKKSPHNSLFCNCTIVTEIYGTIKFEYSLKFASIEGMTKGFHPKMTLLRFYNATATI